MFVRTPRLTLRPAWIEDAPELARAIGHESVVRNLSLVPWPYRLQDAETFLSRPADGRGAFFAICLPETGAIIGGIGVHRADEFGYWLTPSAWGRGYATEAGRGVLGAARHAMGLKRLTSSHFVDNPASGRVLRKLGFRSTGRIGKRFSISRGAEVDAVEFRADLDDGVDCMGHNALLAA